MMRIAKTVRSSILGLAIVLGILLYVSRSHAIGTADSHMRSNMKEKYIRTGGHLILWTAGNWTPLWRVGYETDALTGCPPYVEVSLGGAILQSNVRVAELESGQTK
jgi:hypothetical protein